ncbi:mandelate racemase/muconate lactonizing enzyme family protein [Dongia soli]|uniref:Mandelate racemase/muconate lactonizing enzyme family protein n=1 Tax=Dongia soli TaxID=600628 RepID=A0ABU5EC04_9PROT|nr:mandelate racemase/muconate lactonizing enzyme family protein [Dongia soli]MDY0883579.1 mandelate racemase/muconate lactonizing enzyme family protein [Dongia soli]
MKIDSVDLFFLQMPESDPAYKIVRDTLLVRVRAGQCEGWGECEAAPFVSLASFIMPQSHETCRPINAALLGQKIQDPSDIYRLIDLARSSTGHLLQAPHAFSGVEMALWDVVGKSLDEPVYSLLGIKTVHRRLPYVVAPFGETAEETHARVAEMSSRGFHAVKVGWGRFGEGNLKGDREHLVAAREALGPDGRLFLDTGQIWKNNASSALRYRSIIDEANIEWIEEPFHPAATDAYSDFTTLMGSSRVAAGEHLHDVHSALKFLKESRVGVLQIDCGHLGGIAPAHEISEQVGADGVKIINHTYTSHLALSACLHALAGHAGSDLCEYPFNDSSLSWKISRNHLFAGQDGFISLSEGPGLGIQIDLDAVDSYSQDLEIRLSNRVLYSTPTAR